MFGFRFIAVTAIVLAGAAATSSVSAKDVARSAIGPSQGDPSKGGRTEFRPVTGGTSLDKPTFGEKFKFGLKTNGGPDWLAPLASAEHQYREIATSGMKQMQEIDRKQQKMMDELGGLDLTYPSHHRPTGHRRF
jgi:hypothetical protein